MRVIFYHSPTRWLLQYKLEGQRCWRLLTLSDPRLPEKKDKFENRGDTVAISSYHELSSSLSISLLFPGAFSFFKNQVQRFSLFSSKRKVNIKGVKMHIGQVNNGQVNIGQVIIGLVNIGQVVIGQVNIDKSTTSRPTTSKCRVEIELGKRNKEEKLRQMVDYI